MTPVEFRRHLHAFPELSFKEEKTARFIAEQLSALGIENRSIAGTGILARIEGRGDTRRAVVLRADIDALPIHEAADVAWRSRNEGIMHACGHDMHAAVLFGVLQRLKADGDFDGTVFGLFQPGEELVPGGHRSFSPRNRSKDTTSQLSSASTSSRSLRWVHSASGPANTWPRTTSCISPFTARAGTPPCAS